jgi:hypothetical protein
MRAALSHRAQCFDASAFATPEFWAVASDVVRRLSAKNSSVSEIAIGLADVVTSSRREDLRHD